MKDALDSGVEAAETEGENREWFIEKPLPWWGSLGKRFLMMEKMPRHIAIVMDGNRRYARCKNYASVVEGHSRGFEQLTKVLEWCRELGVHEVTVYAFSIENFKRSVSEVSGLMQMAEEKFQKLLDAKDELEEKQLCIRFFGNMSLLPAKIQRLIARIELLTRDHKNAFLNICVAYTSQDEIVRAMNKAREGVQMGLILEGDIDHELLSGCLDTRLSHPLDLMIRTSERRLSDFLLWQVTDCYIHFESVLWPEFEFWHLFKAFFQYQINLKRIEKERSELPPRENEAKEFSKEAVDRRANFLRWIQNEHVKQLERMASTINS